MSRRLRDIFGDLRAHVGGLAIALVGRAAVDGAERRRAAANDLVVDRLRATLAATFGFEDIPPDPYLEQAARHRVTRVAELERRWSGAENLARERLHQLLEALQMLRDDDVEGARHYLWSVTIGADVEGGGLVHPGSLPGEEVGDG